MKSTFIFCGQVAENSVDRNLNSLCYIERKDRSEVLMVCQIEVTSDFTENLISSTHILSKKISKHDYLGLGFLLLPALPAHDLCGF